MKRHIVYYLFVLAFCAAAPLLANAAVGPDYCDVPVIEAQQREVVERIPQLPVIAEDPEPQEFQAIEPFYQLTEAERDIVARIVWGEARGECPTGQAAVADVVLNRLLDGRFGETIDAVCTPGLFHGLRYRGEVGEAA
jgi:hypothetical protein